MVRVRRLMPKQGMVQPLQSSQVPKTFSDNGNLPNATPPPPGNSRPYEGLWNHHGPLVSPWIRPYFLVGVAFGGTQGNLRFPWCVVFLVQRWPLDQHGMGEIKIPTWDLEWKNETWHINDIAVLCLIYYIFFLRIRSHTNQHINVPWDINVPLYKCLYVNISH